MQSRIGEIARAAELIRAGGLVAFPTETVYGLGADATNPDAVTRLFAVKGRPPEHPVIVHVADPGGLDAWGLPVPDVARRLASACWPGPCTVVVGRRVPGVVAPVTGGRASVGLRMPDHPLALELLRSAGRPLAAPSANRFGRVSPTRAVDVRNDLGDDVDLVLDGGPCAVGLESTIVDCSVDPPVIRREGGMPRETVEEVLGIPVPVVATAGTAPGTLRSHYAPRARVELVGQELVETRAFALRALGLRVGILGAGIEVPDGAEDLTGPGEVEGFAPVLYANLRRADALGLDVVLAVAPHPEGVGAAIGDRLRRAAGEP